MNFKSKQQLDAEKKTFSPLGEEDYILTLIDIKPGTQPKYKAVPDENGTIPQEDIINFTFEVVSYKDGEDAFDEEGHPAAGRKVFFTGRPDSMGFQNDGTPSKTRALVAYITKQDVNDEIELGYWTELIGKSVIANIIQYVNAKGEKKNKISRFLPQRKERPAAKKEKIEDEDIPVIEDDVEEIDPKDIPF